MNFKFSFTLASSDGEIDSMFSSYSGPKRGLLRPHLTTGGGPVFRNLPLFGFLAALVFFFFIFYIYQAQNTELNMMREQIELERGLHIKSKSENLDLKAQIENYKNTEADLKKKLQTAMMNNEECDTNLKNEADKLQSYVIDLEKAEKEQSMCADSLAILTSQLVQSNQTIDALRANFNSTKILIEAQKKTIESLQAQLQMKESQSVREQMKLNAKIAGHNAAAMPQGTANAVTSGKVLLEDENERVEVGGGPFEIMQSPKQQQATTASVAFTVSNTNVNEHPQGIDQKASATSAIERNMAEDDEKNVLLAPPQSKKQSKEAINDEKPMAPNLREPPNLENILGMNREVGFFPEENQWKDGVIDVDHKKVIGGEYV